MFNFGWKTWLTVALGGTSILLVCAMLSQWRYATLGKQVSRNVVKFLTDHGAHVDGGIVSGGVVTVPLKVNTAVNSTILQMLEAVTGQMSQQHPPASSSAYEGDEPTYTSRRQVEDPQKKQPAAAAAAARTTPNPSPRAGGKVAAPSAMSPPSTPPKDDCGFSDPERGKDYEGYNPGEFTPKGTKVSVEQMMAEEEGYQ